ncbi:hypothetical protein [Spiroplasma endosymbiont of Virgichneumon dumeticola]
MWGEVRKIIYKPINFLKLLTIRILKLILDKINLPTFKYGTIN